MSGDEPQHARRSISGRLLRGAVGFVSLVSVALMISGAIANERPAVTLGAVLFAAAAVVAAGVTLAQALRWSALATRTPSLAAYVALLQTTRLTAIFYGWGALAMQGLYVTPLTGLKWQHGWQYAAAMALLALVTIVFGRSMPQPLPGGDTAGWLRHACWAKRMAAAQALVAGVGLAALVMSGKLLSERADWAANRVFVGLAIAILAVSLASIVMQRRLGAPAAQ